MSDAPLRLAAIHEEVARALKASRRKAEPTLIAVSKRRSADDIEPLLRAGHRVFGESRVQEAEDKWPALRAAYPDCKLHMIGQLQSNKAAQALDLFDVIHSLDRTSLLEAMERAIADGHPERPCFVQVNIGAEEQKGGVPLAEFPDLLAAVRASRVPLAGLMCIPPADEEPAPYFALLAKLAERHGLDGLSMGMSADFATATLLGATHLRVGSALFEG